MLYAFPYEDAFLLVVGGVIVGLLVLRIKLARRRRQASMTKVPTVHTPESSE